MPFLSALLLALPQAAAPTLAEVLPGRADELAFDLAGDLQASGALERHGIRAFAFLGAIGDEQGALRDRLLSHLINELGLERIAEREERVVILDRYYRKDGFEKGIYDPAGLKELGGSFRDNEGILGARIYTVASRDGLEIYAQAELWDAQRAAMVWNKTVSLVVAAPVAPPPPPKEPMAPWILKGLLFLAVVGVAVGFLRWLNRREQIRRAAARGGQAIARTEQKKHDLDLREEGARRAHAAADRLGAVLGRIELRERDGMLSVVEQLHALARAFEKAPSGSFRGSVEARRDPAVASLAEIARHDERTLGMVEEIERAAGTLVDAVAAGGATVPPAAVRTLAELAASATRRLGERADLVRARS